METPHDASLPGPFHFVSVNGTSLWTFWPSDLDLWPMPLTYQLGLDILPIDRHAKIQVRTSVCLAGIARRTGGHTHTWRQNYYTQHVRNVGCKNIRLRFLRQTQMTGPLLLPVSSQVVSLQIVTACCVYLSHCVCTGYMLAHILHHNRNRSKSLLQSHPGIEYSIKCM